MAPQKKLRNVREENSFSATLARQEESRQQRIATDMDRSAAKRTRKDTLDIMLFGETAGSARKLGNLYERTIVFDRQKEEVTVSRTALGKTADKTYVPKDNNSNVYRLERVKKVSKKKISETQYDQSGIIVKKTKEKDGGAFRETYERLENGGLVRTLYQKGNYLESLSEPDENGTRTLVKNDGGQRIKRFTRSVDGTLTLTGRKNGSFSKFTDKAEDGKSQTTKIKHAYGLIGKTYSERLEPASKDDPNGNVIDKETTGRRIGLYRSQKAFSDDGNLLSKTRKLGKSGKLFERTTFYQPPKLGGAVTKTVSTKVLNGHLVDVTTPLVPLSEAEKAAEQRGNVGAYDAKMASPKNQKHASAVVPSVAAAPPNFPDDFNAGVPKQPGGPAAKSNLPQSVHRLSPRQQARESHRLSDEVDGDVPEQFVKKNDNANGRLFSRYSGAAPDGGEGARRGHPRGLDQRLLGPQSR